MKGIKIPVFKKVVVDEHIPQPAEKVVARSRPIQTRRCSGDVSPGEPPELGTFDKHNLPRVGEEVYFDYKRAEWYSKYHGKADYSYPVYHDHEGPFEVQDVRVKNKIGWIKIGGHWYKACHFYQ